MSKVEFYHYTDGPGKNAILQQGTIKSSNGAADARFGPGVYGTSLSPDAGKKKIAWNNWDGISSSRAMAKASWAIRVLLPASMVRVEDTIRDVLRYIGGDINLNNHVHEVIRV